ncbi:MAG: hypothetical protein JSU94_12005 [Phycisphaerales bacterium]|nr:MAG: hypothetical protein JSU94_12005 [Phycisphaerales bacterium]
MPFNTRSVAVTMAVICFFGVGFISWFSGLSPFTCCRRAVIAAMFAGAAGILTVKAVNAIVISAMASSQMKQRKEEAGDSNS